MSRIRAFTWSGLLALAAVGCGGGGGGGSAGGATPVPPAPQVTFEGFGFRVANGPETSVPPLEQPTASPPSLGAPLNLTILFHFSGVPAGPFSQASLPVFTTPGQVPPSVKPPAGTAILPAKGSYALVVHPKGGASVEFRPFVPTAPLKADLGAPPAAVPGLLPGSVYTAALSDQPGAAIPNLAPAQPGDAAREVSFGTTSNPAAFYPKGAGDLSPPEVVSRSPVPFTAGFQPATFAGDVAPVPVTELAEGPEEVVLTYDRALEPSAQNLDGRDLDGDGLIEPAFFFASRATRLLVAHQVPAGALGSAAGFAALSAVADGPGVTVAQDGSEILLADGAPAGLPATPASFPGTPASLACGADPGLLFVLLAVEGGNDLLTVVDHVLGDPGAALPGNALDTGLDDVVGLTTLLDGRLVAFDRGSRRIVELLPVVERLPGTPDAPAPGVPTLVALSLGDGVTGFLSAPLDPVGVASVLDLRDLAQMPDGRLLALGVVDQAGTLALLRLRSIDPDGDGRPGGLDGSFSGAAADVLLTLANDYRDVVADSGRHLLALNVDDDTVDLLDPLLGKVGTVAHQVGRFGTGAPASPARAITVGRLEYPARVTLSANSDPGAVVTLRPAGLLPFGTEVAAMERNSLASLTGASAWNADAAGQVSAWGALERLVVTTAAPVAGDDLASIEDVVFEDFVDTVFQAQEAPADGLLAEWAAITAAGPSSGGLRAAVGSESAAMLGDFLPYAGTEFDPEVAYDRAKFGQGKSPEPDPDVPSAMYRVVLLDTDAQAFPLPDGSTPGVNQAVMIFGGHFAFRDFIIPEGVHLVVVGSQPLRITATGRVEIHGLIDVAGVDGFSDDTFDSGFLPVPGGPAGPGGGRGGDGHPTLSDPAGIGGINQYVTPERGERGWGPVLTPAGVVALQPVGGHGGLSTVGYDPSVAGFPKVDNNNNDENHRPPGGGGGTFRGRGQSSREGSGSYLVQSNSTWFPFSLCPNDDKISNALYGNEENFVAGKFPNHPLQCVYMTGTPADPDRLQPGADGGNAVFVDADADNDFIGAGGELSALFGGQGGGGGGSRVDSMRHGVWAADPVGGPDSPFIPPHYPKLFTGVFLSPTAYDAKPGGGGGGGGAFQLRAFGDIVMGKTGRIAARGGHGGGGERVRNSSVGGGGGGGSGGAVLLQAAGAIRLLADPGHRSASYMDTDGDMGAAIDVSGGFGRDARTASADNTQLQALTYDATRSDGGQGGFGLIQLQAGGGPGQLEVQQGANPFARQRAALKLGGWTGDGTFLQADHLSFGGVNSLSNELRYIDMLHYRYFRPEGVVGNLPRDRYLVLNGTFPPVIPSVDGDNGHVAINEWPPGSGQFWSDTAMLVSPLSQGRPVVKEPEPEKVMKTYNGWNSAFFEINNLASHPDFPSTPGTTYKGEAIPFSVRLVEPDGTPPMVEVGGELVFDPANLVDRLPLVPPSLTPPPLGTISRGTSRWLDFSGARLRPRDLLGRTPPFFAAVHGTHNAGVGPVPAGQEGRVVLGGVVPGHPARFVDDSGPADPGLTPDGPPFNDLKVDAPDSGVGLVNAVTDNAHVALWFQGAHPVRPGSQVPDPATLSAWTADLTALDGHTLVRFQVVFDLDAQPDLHPLGPASLRPQVDWVRLRTSY